MEVISDGFNREQRINGEEPGEYHFTTDMRRCVDNDSYEIPIHGSKPSWTAIALVYENVRVPTI